jgi:RNA polymerase sigma factor (sigma-70 family)
MSSCAVSAVFRNCTAASMVAGEHRFRASRKFCSASGVKAAVLEFDMAFFQPDYGAFVNLILALPTAGKCPKLCFGMSQLFSSVKTLVSTQPEHAAEAGIDLALVRRVQAGEVRAFDQLITKYRERLYAIVYNLTANREDASDLTQEAFIKAFRSIHNFKGESSFFTWLYRIAVNGSLTHLKKSRLRRFFSFENINEEVSQSEIVEALADRTHTDKSLLIKELQEKLNEALQKLSPNHRAVVVLFEIEGLSHQEIATVMECSEGTVRSRLHYAKQQLQIYLQNYLR